MVGKSELTQKTYRADLEAFGRFVGCPAAEPGVGRLLIGGRGYTYKVLLDYTGFLKEKGLQNTSINKKVAPIRTALSLAKSIGLIDWQVRVQYLKTEAYRDTRGPGSAGWKRLIVEAESRQDAKGARDQAILRLLHDMALRRNEVRTSRS